MASSGQFVHGAEAEMSIVIITVELPNNTTGEYKVHAGAIIERVENGIRRTFNLTGGGLTCSNGVNLYDNSLPIPNETGLTFKKALTILHHHQVSIVDFVDTPLPSSSTGIYSSPPLVSIRLICYLLCFSLFLLDIVAKQPLRELVAQACNVPLSDIDVGVVQRMVRKFGFSVDIAIRTDDKELLSSVYEKSTKLPSVQTTFELEQNGFVLDGAMINGTDNLQICFKGSVPHVLKVLTPTEYDRALTFKSAMMSEPSCSWIIPFELYSRHLKFYVFMPLHPVTLEHLPSLDSSTAPVFWACISGALDFLHGYCYAHNDVKPPNILINSCDEFILTDLGSLVMFKSRSASTQAYIPRKLWDHANQRGPLASIQADFWMLAMTIYEKACNGDMSGSESPTKSKILEAIEANERCAQFYPALLERLQMTP